MSDGEEEWKARIFVNSGWQSVVRGLSGTESKLIFFDQGKLSEEELALPFDGVLYLPPEGLLTFSTEQLDEEVEEFEKFVSFVDGIEGKCLAIWVDGDDRDMKDTMFEKLHLEERNCEGFWDYTGNSERDEEVYPRICKFFEENAHQCQIKPAKRM